jgi:hypothetical protein
MHQQGTTGCGSDHMVLQKHGVLHYTEKHYLRDTKSLG